MTLHIIVITVIACVIGYFLARIAYKNGYSHGYYDGVFQKEVDLRKKFKLHDKDIMNF